MLLDSENIDEEKQLKLNSLENKHFKLVGLPFYNEQLQREFKEALESKILA